MKLLKMLALACGAVAVLAIFAVPASATQLTSPQGTVYTSSVAGTSTNLEGHRPFINSVKCGHSAWNGKVEAHGAAVTTKVGLSSLTFTGCNSQYVVKTPGYFEIHTDTAVNDGNGRVTWTGASFETLSPAGGACVYTTNGTDAGTLTGTDSGNAVIDINAKIPRTSGNFLCGSPLTLTGKYAITTPSTLTVD